MRSTVKLSSTVRRIGYPLPYLNSAFCFSLIPFSYLTSNPCFLSPTLVLLIVSHLKLFYLTSNPRLSHLPLFLMFSPLHPYFYFSLFLPFPFLKFFFTLSTSSRLPSFLPSFASTFLFVLIPLPCIFFFYFFSFLTSSLLSSFFLLPPFFISSRLDFECCCIFKTRSLKFS